MGVFDTKRRTAGLAVGQCIKKTIKLCFQKDVLKLLQQRLTSLKKSPWFWLLSAVLWMCRERPCCERHIAMPAFLAATALRPTSKSPSMYGCVTLVW